MKNKIRFLVLWVGTKCTLKCKDCCNLIPYLRQESYDTDDIVKNLEYITESMEIDLLQIQGGEPFTHKDISKIIEMCATNCKIHKIEVASNGTIMPNEETINIIKRYSDKVDVRFSVYKCTENIRQNIENKLNELYGIKVNEYDFVYDTGEWFELGKAESEKDVEAKIIDATYKKCPNKSCWTLYKNYFASCGRMIAYLQLKEEKISGSNIIDINKIRNEGVKFIDEFQKFEKWYNTKSSELCGYCKITDELIPAAIQLKNNEIKNKKKNIKFEKVFLNDYGFYELKNKPTLEERKNEFENEYYQQSMASYQNEYSEKELKMFRNIIKRKEMLIDDGLKKAGNIKDKNDKKFLDVGCGEGFVLNYFYNSGWNVTGIDFSSYGIEHNNPNMNEYLLKGDCDEILPELVSKNEKYDVINMDAFLDMALNPKKVLNNCKELLDENGVLVVKVANNYSRLQLHLLENGKLQKEYWLDEKGHPSYFGKDSLKTFIEANGYEMIDLICESLIDLNLFNDLTNYYEVPEAGKKCYEARVEMENMYSDISPELTLDLFRIYAQMGFGREIVGVFVKK